MFRLPPADSPVRTVLDMGHVGECLAPENSHRIPSLPEAVSMAKRSMAENKGIHSVNSIVRKANDDIWLVQIGPRGGVKRLWNFTAR